MYKLTKPRIVNEMNMFIQLKNPELWNEIINIKPRNKFISYITPRFISEKLQIFRAFWIQGSY